MNTILKKISLLFIAIIVLSSCSNDDDSGDFNLDENPITDMHLLHSISENDFEFNLYSEKGVLEVGYNEFAITIKDMKSETYLEDVNIDWMPMMYMESMAHSGPHSKLGNQENSKIYQGYIVFQMAENETEYWELDVSYSINGELVEKSIPLSIVQPRDSMVKTQVFTGADEQRYILAYVAPKKPEVATNDMLAVLYTMEDMHTFSLVENYTVGLDPRMPGMGNHGSPNNKDLTYNAQTGFYEGKLSMTMTGYWRLNLQLLNENGDLLKGEEITEEHPESSLYFELEF